MAFTIPNHADANSPFQAEPDSVDFDILAAGYSGSGVISGCAVTAQGSPNMTVAVASGVVSVAGVRATVSGANATIGTADGTNPRFDTITINNSGTIATTAGTAAAVPELPAIPSNSIVLALIFVPANDTTIATVQITDKRVFVSSGSAGGVLDDIIMGIGSDSDIAILNRSTSLSADAEVTNIIEGTSDHLGVAANSLIVSNVTNDGDIMFVVSDAGNSKGLLKLDGANGRVVIHGGDLLMSGAQKIYFYDIGGEYMSSDGSTLTITGATALTPTIGSTAWANANHAHAASNSGGTVTATSATVATTVTVTDNESTAENNLVAFVADAATSTGNHGLEMDGNLAYNPSTGTLTATAFSGTVSTATVGTTVTVTDNESTAENNLVTFVADAATSTGNHGLEMDGNFHYNPSTGLVTATGFSGNLTGTLQTASQTNITAVGTIATGTWEGTTIAVDQGGTGATSLTNLITLTTHTTGNYVATLANATNGGTTITNGSTEGGAATVALNFNDLTDTAINVAADSIVFLDADGTASRRDTIADLATAMAGTNLTASSGQLVAAAAGAGLGLVIALGG